MTTAEARYGHASRFRIEPSSGWRDLRLHELWDFRDLLYFLVWRDVKVRYKQTVLGAMWAVLQPLSTVLVFTLFLGKLAKIPSDNVPYPLFAYAGLLPWTFFAAALTQSSSSLITNVSLLTKVYFPRLYLPVSSVLGAGVDLLVSMAFFGVFAWYFGVRPEWTLVFVPLFVLLAACTALGVGISLAILNAQFRDIRYTVPFMIQLWMFATPVVYPSSLLSEPWRTLYGLNPMAGCVEGLRWALLGTQPPGPMIFVSCVVSIGVLIAAVLLFRHGERQLADII